MKRYNKLADILLNAAMILLVILCIIPLWLVISVSLTSEAGISSNGYTLLPSELSFEAYKFLWESRGPIIDAYKVTIITTVVGTVLSTLIMLLYAYPLSKPDFRYKKFFTFYMFFTMLFSGGLVSWYIVCTKMLNLGDTYAGLILPYVTNAWYVLILRTFLKSSVPPALIEAAKIDGAGEFRILFRVVVPIAVPGIATIALFQTLKYWNDWWLALNFITSPKMQNLQIYLQNLLANISDMANNPDMAANASFNVANMPSEGVRMALCIVAMGPILIAYPFFQKYFIQGLTVGSVKE